MAEQFTGNVEIQNNQSNTTILLDGDVGKIGVGTTNTRAVLNVAGPSDNLMRIQDTQNGNLLLIGSDEQLPNFIRLRPQSGSGLAITNRGDRIGLFVQASSGNVGIRTTDPQTTLDVNGNVRVSGDILLTGADCAEEFSISVSQAIEPGTVMVIDSSGNLRQSSKDYDKKVAGVISGAGEYKPGLVLDKQKSSGHRVPIAMMGKVYCMVDADHSPIDVGDLLTTSSTPGHAMKATDPTKAFGTVIGKALRPFTNGKGLIPILVALQ